MAWAQRNFLWNGKQKKIRLVAGIHGTSEKRTNDLINWVKWHNWRAPWKGDVCTYFGAIFQVARNPLKFGMPILFVLKNVPVFFFQESRKMWTKLHAFHHLMEGPILTTSLIHLPLKGWENVHFELLDIRLQTCCYCSNQWHQYQLHWVIPRPDNQCHAQGLINDLTSVHLVDKAFFHCLGCHPVVQFSQSYRWIWMEKNEWHVGRIWQSLRLADL